MKRYSFIPIMLLFSISNTLISLESFNEPVTAKGEILIITGRVLDKGGNPLNGTSVEIWQTDSKGVYDHPGDSDREGRDKGFQFFGTSITNTNGEYSFRTILPGRYEPRPRHIHVKIKREGKVILITQIYFRGDGESGGVGGSNTSLFIDLKTIERISYGTFDFVIGRTDTQSEGPYYPVSDFSSYDNDLANVP